ncbi:manganese efflux pump [Paenibacillus glycanilyticus]|uniref:Sporulation membrane protein YtaF n=1 Tax=Paenibacillus glycanilyticus TaxID=126569 RepID=A0ABQ6GHA2_9BACL|nr:manganese efflux pump [Paenibacillus glycanilyticus]GLX69650.1 sporulation membrane protein YtaF [Paenibacillus glycanilyticus]
MHWFTIAIIGIASNIDNLGIGFSFGSRSTKVPFFSNLVIALLSIIATYTSMSAGLFVSHLISSSWGNIIGGFTIIVMGAIGLRSVKFITKSESESVQSEHPTKPDLLAAASDKDKDHNISWLEAITLGLALSVNCIATGLGAGASGVSPLYTAISVGLFSLLTVDIGIRFGNKLSRTWFGKYSDVFGCLLLILIGLYEVIH